MKCYITNNSCAISQTAVLYHEQQLCQLVEQTEDTSKVGIECTENQLQHKTYCSNIAQYTDRNHHQLSDITVISIKLLFTEAFQNYFSYPDLSE